MTLKLRLITYFLLLSIGTSSVFSQILPKLVFVKGGAFQMGNNQGSADERPVHTVILSDFYIGKYEVTVQEYQTYCKATGKKMPSMPKDEWYEEHPDAKKWAWKSKYPILHVSWNDANNYCKWLSKKTGEKYTLPTEAQWEYAARGGQKSRNYKYSGSNNINKVAWYDETTYEKGPRPVGTLKANELGIYDMSGNAWEWCWDRYARYRASNSKNPKGPDRGIFRVIRGGSWYYVDDMARITSRDGPYPHYTNYNYGFRIVKIP
jgi:formylglycine-generating enzyme required for sulfatase activity